MPNTTKGRLEPAVLRQRPRFVRRQTPSAGRLNGSLADDKLRHLENGIDGQRDTALLGYILDLLPDGIAPDRIKVLVPSPRKASGQNRYWSTRWSRDRID